MWVPRNSQLVNFNVSQFCCNTHSLLSALALLRASVPGVPSDILPSLSTLQGERDKAIITQ